MRTLLNVTGMISQNKPHKSLLHRFLFNITPTIKGPLSKKSLMAQISVRNLKLFLKILKAISDSPIQRKEYFINDGYALVTIKGE